VNVEKICDELRAVQEAVGRECRVGVELREDGHAVATVRWKTPVRAREGVRVKEFQIKRAILREELEVLRDPRAFFRSLVEGVGGRGKGG